MYSLNTLLENSSLCAAGKMFKIVLFMVAKKKKKEKKQCIDKNMDSILQQSQWNIMEDKLKLNNIDESEKY